MSLYLHFKDYLENNFLSRRGVYFAGEAASEGAEALGGSALDGGEDLSEEAEAAKEDIEEVRDATTDTNDLSILEQLLDKFREGWEEVLNFFKGKGDALSDDTKSSVEKILEPGELDARRTEKIAAYESTLNALDHIPDRPSATDTELVTAYFASLRRRMRDVMREYEKLQIELQKPENGGQPLNQLESKFIDEIVRVTEADMKPVKDAIVDQGELKDHNSWSSVVISYTGMHTSLEGLGVDPTSEAEINRYNQVIRKRVEDATGLSTVNLEDLDQKKNPLLYLITMIAKAFGADIHIDPETNAVVGWSGSGKNKDIDFMRVASAYVEQGDWQNDFDRLQINNPDVRAWLSTTLLNSTCFPTGSVEEIDKARVTRKLFMEEIAKLDSEGNIVNIVHALGELNKRPLEIVSPGQEAQPGKQLGIADLSAYITNPGAFYRATRSGGTT